MGILVKVCCVGIAMGARYAGVSGVAEGANRMIGTIGVGHGNNFSLRIFACLIKQYVATYPPIYLITNPLIYLSRVHSS